MPEVNKSPCGTCYKNVVGCTVTCEEWRKWFRHEWRMVRKQFLDRVKGGGSK